VVINRDLFSSDFWWMQTFPAHSEPKLRLPILYHEYTSRARALSASKVRLPHIRAGSWSLLEAFASFDSCAKLRSVWWLGAVNQLGQAVKQWLERWEKRLVDLFK
jgi:hypothetical protein